MIHTTSIASNDGIVHEGIFHLRDNEGSDFTELVRFTNTPNEDDVREVIGTMQRKYAGMRGQHVTGSTPELRALLKSVLQSATVTVPLGNGKKAEQPNLFAGLFKLEE